MGNVKELAVETDLKGSFVSTAKANINGRALKLSHKFPSGVIGLETSYKRWTVGYDHPSRDITIEHKQPVFCGQLSIKQRIPQSQWFVVPSPEVKLTTSPVAIGKLKDELQLSYDYQKRVAKFEEEVTYAGRYKVKASADSKTAAKGASLSLTAKVGKPWVSSVGATLSQSTGPVLKYEGEVAGALKAKADYTVRSKTAKVEISPRPINKVRLTLTTTLKTDKLGTPPPVWLGAKFEP